MKNKLQEKRRESGLFQVELAARSGVSIATVNKLENWGFRPSPATAEKLAKALHCKTSDLFPDGGR